MTTDYETLGLMHAQALAAFPPVIESYMGSDIVVWQGNIERQIEKFISTYNANRNQAYVDKLREFLAVWRKNQITGSMNQETIAALENVAQILAVDNWQLSNYFSNLRDRLRTLQASEEELPRQIPAAPQFPRKPSAKTLAKEIPSDFGPDADQVDIPKEKLAS